MNFVTENINEYLTGLSAHLNYILIALIALTAVFLLIFLFKLVGNMHQLIQKKIPLKGSKFKQYRKISYYAVIIALVISGAAYLHTVIVTFSISKNAGFLAQFFLALLTADIIILAINCLIFRLFKFSKIDQFFRLC